jgi:hypothetical protein
MEVVKNDRRSKRKIKWGFKKDISRY